MTHAKRNKSSRPLGKGRGVPVRLAGHIARRYALTHIVIYTLDRQERSRVLYWARNDNGAAQCAVFCEELTKLHGWSEKVRDFDCSHVRKTRERVKELELQLSRIIERDGDAITIAKQALKLPEDL